MTISQVYGHYQIMPSLQLHMLRVAGVAQLLAENCTQKVDRNEIIIACLLHDMGNIAKFDLERFPAFIQPEGLAYWQTAKADFVAKYGSNPHHATVAIAHELGVSERVVELIDAIGFNREKQNFETNDYSRKICAYADMRVAPEGITSLEKRLEDARKRYHEPGEKDSFHYAMRAFLRKIELQLTEACTIEPQKITEGQIVKLFPGLRNWEI